MESDLSSIFTSLGFSAISILVLVFLALLFSSYVKIVTVLSIIRLGLGASSLPAVVVTSGLAVGLSFFVMYPTLQETGAAMDNALRSRVTSGSPSDQDRAVALSAGVKAWKGFLQRNARSEEVEKFSAVAKNIDQKRGLAGENAQPGSASEPGWRVLAPAFLVSELREAFETGLSLFLPFLVIDLLAVTLLTSIGATQLSPALVAFPIKLFVFVMLDGWALITTNLVSTYTS